MKLDFFNKYKLFLGFGLCLFLLTSCKPTEKGYKAAYDAAVGKRMEMIESSTPVTGVISAEGPNISEYKGKQIFVLTDRLKTLDEQEKLHKYCVAVSVYKMPTNCIAQVKALKEEGFEATAGRSSDDKFYVIAGSFKEMDEAIEFMEKYKAGEDRHYVGLPDSPVLINNI